MCPKLEAEESLIVKSAPNQFMYAKRERSYNFQNDYYNPKLGIVYDELWEICGRSLEHAKANKNGDTDLYHEWFYGPTVFPSPPGLKYPIREFDDEGNLIKEKEYYTYKEMEELTGKKFYFIHNFHADTPCFYKRRMFWGYEWDRMNPIGDIGVALIDNDLFSSLYYKYTGLQLITAAFMSAYGWCK